MPEEGSKDVEVSPGQAVLDLDGDSVVCLGESIIIDARDKKGVPGFPHGYTDRKESDKYSRVVHRIRGVLVSGLYYDDISKEELRKLAGLAFIDELQQMGFKGIESAQVRGKFPGHWYPDNHIASKFVLSPERWQKEKLTLRLKLIHSS